MRICFWNTCKNKEINRYLVDIVKENGIDILVLAEYGANRTELANALSQQGTTFERLITIGCDRIRIFAKNITAEPGFQNKYCSLQLVNGQYIFACIHLPSKANASIDKRKVAIGRIVEEIHKFEDEVGTKQTVIVGDFNENPYEAGCMGASGFHGIPSYEDALKISRIILGEQFAMFYNPMWNLLGDFSFPPGTYYYSGNEVVNPYWNMYDQVIISPQLRKNFIESELKILCETRKDSFVDKKFRPAKGISDHLPIIFEIREV